MTPNNNEYKDYGLQITFSTKMRQSDVKNWLIARLCQGCTGDPMASSCIRKLTPQRMMGKYQEGKTYPMTRVLNTFYFANFPSTENYFKIIFEI